MTEEENKDKKKRRWLLLLLLLLLFVVAGIVIGAIWSQSRNSETILTPNRAPQAEDNAESIGDDGDEKLPQSEGGGAVSITYAKEVSISLSDKSATLMFANPTKSNQDMVLQLVINDITILQSGKLEPGSMVSTLSLPDDAEKRLTAGGYDGKFLVLFYDRESGEQAMVNTEIPVSVTVTE